MKKEHIIAFFIAAVILMPPLNIHIPPRGSSPLWVWMVLIFAFTGACLIRTSISPILKALIVYLFGISFLSHCPYASFNAYCAIIACLGVYLVFLKISDWKPILQGIECAFWILFFIVAMQSLHKDTLLSFGLKTGVLYGTTTNKMMTASLIACMAPFLIIKNKFYILPLGMLLILKKYDVLYLSLFCLKNKMATELVFGRPNVWVYTIKTYFEHPFIGWGPATYKMIFPAISVNSANHTLCHLKDATRWFQAHNDYLQVLWETGGIGFALFMAYIISVVRKSCKDIKKLIGLVIIGLDMMVHFPMRMAQTVPLLILFMAYCEKKEG